MSSQPTQTVVTGACVVRVVGGYVVGGTLVSGTTNQCTKNTKILYYTQHRHCRVDAAALIDYTLKYYKDK